MEDVFKSCYTTIGLILILVEMNPKNGKTLPYNITETQVCFEADKRTGRQTEFQNAGYMSTSKLRFQLVLPVMKCRFIVQFMDKKGKKTSAPGCRNLVTQNLIVRTFQVI